MTDKEVGNIIAGRLILLDRGVQPHLVNMVSDEGLEAVGDISHTAFAVRSGVAMQWCADMVRTLAEARTELAARRGA
jgi:hypothetical protein